MGFGLWVWVGKASRVDLGLIGDWIGLGLGRAWLGLTFLLEWFAVDD